MAIAFRSIQATAYSGGNPNGDTPAGFQAGDLLLAHVLRQGSTTLTMPTGWTLVAVTSGANPNSNTGTGSSGGGYWLYSRIADGSEGNTVWTAAAAGKGVVVVAAYSGVDPATPVEAAIQANFGAAASYDMGAITTLSANAVVVLIPSYNSAALASPFNGFTTTPTGFTQRLNSGYHAAANYSYAGWYDRAAATAGSVDPAAHSKRLTSASGAFLVSLRESSAPTATPRSFAAVVG
jgi:hypothetical protein